jgi:hypothetical protein
LGALGKPSRRFCTKNENINKRPRSGKLTFSDTRGNTAEGEGRTYLKTIGQPSGVLEYDAVLAINDEFRKAVS